MDEDDPERRIAELESQLADQNTARSDQLDDGSRLTAGDVHYLAFSSAPAGRRGYHEDEVDAFLDRVEATLRDPTASGALTPADIRDVAFSKPPIGKRGYHEEEVDAFLRRVALELSGRPGQQSAVDRGQRDFGATTGTGARHLRHSDESSAQTILNHVSVFWAELFQNHSVVTWRAPLILGLVFVVLGFAAHPAYFVVAGCFLIWAAIAWRTNS